MTKNVDAIRQLFGAMKSQVGNLPSLPGIFPDYPAPIVRNAAGEREIVMARWGMPTSPVALMEATKKRATKLEAKGQPVDFKELLRLEPDSGVNKLPPVPPDNRSPKGPGTDPEPDAGSHPKRTKNPDQQGQTANTKQNTTHQGYQQDR
jgi:hypothetical protein